MMRVDAVRFHRWMSVMGLVVLCAGRVLAGVDPNEVAVAEPELPCVILIVANELGYGDLGCYGQRLIQTPHIDELAERAVRFTESYAGGAADTSTRAALLTGGASKDGLSSGVATLAGRLKRAGYHTGFIGYWGLGGFGSAKSPQQQGFDEVVAYADRRQAEDLYTDHLYRRDLRTGFEGREPLQAKLLGHKKDYLPDLLTQAATRFCKTFRPQERNGYRPFFLLLSYPVPAAVAARSGPIPDAGGYSSRGWPAIQTDRANAIAGLDHDIGEIMDELDHSGTALNTLIILTSSLGPEGKPPMDNRFFKSTGAYAAGTRPLGEGRLRVPLIVRWPFWTRTNRVSDLLVGGQDIAPTVLEAVRLRPPEDMDGISFLPTLEGQSQTNRHETLSWVAEDKKGNVHEAVRRGPWKCVRAGADQPWQLYDLKSDPAEQDDLAGKHPDIVRKLAVVFGEAGPAGR